MCQKLLAKCFRFVAISFTAMMFTSPSWADGGCDIAVTSPCPVETVVISGSGGGGGGGGAPGDTGCGGSCGMVNVGYPGSTGGRQTISNPPLPAGRFTRTTPACMREQLAFTDVANFLMAGGNPMTMGNMGYYSYTELPSFRGSMAYPAGPYWTKMQRNFYDPDGGYVISIHFEWNVSTGQFTYPPHFSSTAAQGCGA